MVWTSFSVNPNKTWNRGRFEMAVVSLSGLMFERKAAGHRLESICWWQRDLHWVLHNPAWAQRNNSDWKTPQFPVLYQSKLRQTVHSPSKVQCCWLAHHTRQPLRKAYGHTGRVVQDTQKRSAGVFRKYQILETRVVQLCSIPWNEFLQHKIYIIVKTPSYSYAVSSFNQW